MNLGHKFSLRRIQLFNLNIPILLILSGFIFKSSLPSEDTFPVNEGAIFNTTTINVRVNHDDDDAEEKISNGNIDLSSSDLEFVDDDGDQIVGMRFQNITIPQGAVITNAYIQFVADESQSTGTNLNIKVEEEDNALRFNSTDDNVSDRNISSTSVPWSPPSWSSGDSGSDQRTPDITSLIQLVVNRSGWSNGNSIVLFIDGSGHRTAVSHDNDEDEAPLLVITYSTCAITITQSDESSCMNNGTNTNSSDDFFQITFNATTSGSGSQYEVVLNANTDGTGGTVLNTGGTDYGTAVTVGSSSSPPFVADGSTTYSITLREEGNPTCHQDYTSSPVSSCSNCSSDPVAGTATLTKN